MTSKTALILATTAAIALGGFDMRPAAAAPEGGPAIVKQNSSADEFSSQRKRRRGGSVAPLVAFGAIVGTIGAIAAANSRREAYYGGGPYYYAEPRYVPAPQSYVHQHYVQPPVRHHYGPRPGYGDSAYWRHQRGPIGGGTPTPPVPNSSSGDGRL